MAYELLSPEHAALHAERKRDACSDTFLPEGKLTASETDDTYFRLQEEELRLITGTHANGPYTQPEDYARGTARYTDDILDQHFGDGLLVTSEHATTHWTLNHLDTSGAGGWIAKNFECGTIAAGSSLAQDLNGTHLSMSGLQSGNANNTRHHPFNDRVARYIQVGSVDTFVSLHGMRMGLVDNLDDVRGYDMLLGVGDNPSTETLRLARTIVESAKNHGLKAGINRPVVNVFTVDDHPAIERDQSGKMRTSLFKAPVGTTRANAEAAARAAGQPLAAVQIELAANVRIAPRVFWENDDVYIPRGISLAYHALAQAISDYRTTVAQVNSSEQTLFAM